VVTPSPEFVAHRLTAGRFVAFFIMGVTIYGAADAAREHQFGSATPEILILVGVSLIAYVLGVRPAVVEDLRGIIVRNPLRTSEIPWAAVTDVDVVDVLRVHTEGATVRCFSVPRRRPRASKPRMSPREYGFPAVPSDVAKRDALTTPAGISRADYIAGRLLEKAKQQQGTSAGSLVTSISTSSIVVLACAVVFFAAAAIVR
jgi:Bacterial PH domain